MALTTIVCHNMSNFIYANIESLKPLQPTRKTINISNFSTLFNFHTCYLERVFSFSYTRYCRSLSLSLLLPFLSPTLLYGLQGIIKYLMWGFH